MHFSLATRMFSPGARLLARKTGFGCSPAVRLNLRLSLLFGWLLAAGGCTSVLSPINGIPAGRLPPQFLGVPQATKQPINIARLRQEPPPEYLLDKGDILGVYIEGVLGKSDEAPPVHFPDKDSDLPPATGFPVPIRDDGTLSLPLVPPILVRGLTLSQAEDLIRRMYTVDYKILQEGRDRITVSTIRERLYSVVVIREDGGLTIEDVTQERGKKQRSQSRKGHGYTIKLPAYKNDLLHALAETGGLPALIAKNEVLILRGKLADATRRDEFVRAFYQYHSQDPCLCPPPLPDDPTITRIPLRLYPGDVPTFLPQDIILETGDIVMVEARETEVFYTGGLLPGGEFQLPRDYDLDVLGAIAVAGQGVGSDPRGASAGGGGGSLIGAGFSGAPPTQLFVLRRTPCGGQVTISVDLIEAINNPAARILVQPGDTLILRYKLQEEILNFSLAAFFTYGIQRLLQESNN